MCASCAKPPKKFIIPSKRPKAHVLHRPIIKIKPRQQIRSSHGG